MSLRLTPSLKIAKASEYQAVFKNGKMLAGKYWQIIAKPTNKNNARLGLAIAKKAQRLAINRNRLKRIAREVFRLEQDNFKNYDFVVLAKKSAVIKNKILADELSYLFKKATI